MKESSDMLNYKIDKSKIYITEFEFENPVLVKYLESIPTENQSTFIIEALEFGLNTLATVSSQAEVREIESALRKVREELEKTQGAVVRDMQNTFNNQLDESNQLSLISVFKEKILRELVDELSPEAEGSPFASIKKDLEKVIHELSAKRGAKAVESKTAAKGNSFELDVDALVKAESARHGDLAEFVGADAGGSTKVGDTLVTFAEAYNASGKEFKVVWEAKTQKKPFKSDKGFLSVPAVSQELNAAMEHRQADCGIFVADSEGLDNQPEWQEFHGNKLMIVLDREDPDERIVRLAYLWTKTVAARNRKSETSLNIGRIESLLTGLQTQVKAISSLKRHHTMIEDGLRYSMEWVKTHGEKFETLYNDLHQELLKAEEED
jgi:hypothetical protein